ncbi:MAG: hypothetical protein AB7E47_04255 [Desulfovibrionaceae bacterium]
MKKRTPQDNPADRYKRLRAWFAANNVSIADIARRIGMDRRNLARSLKLHSCSARTIRLCVEAGVPAELLPALTSAPAYRTDADNGQAGERDRLVRDGREMALALERVASLDNALERLEALEQGLGRDLEASLERALEERLHRLASVLETSYARRADELAGRMHTALEARLDEWTAAIADRVQETLADNHARNLQTLLVEAKKVFDNFDYVKYMLDTMATAFQGDALAAHLGELTSGELKKLKQQQDLLQRSLAGIAAQQESLARELRVIVETGGEIKAEFTAMRPTLKSIAMHTESLSPLLKSAIQKLTRLKVSGY